ncbi:hypothetical protein [Streptomyces sp. NPDC085665]|uniref:hypothetical protein n=1 Tax=Streptomyces sp. NPDC085665 TaxID=3365735 RepID=UPI0037D407D8
MADSLAPLLRTLRARAGNPSYRAIERLISTQGRKAHMRRATIQEKLTGKSSANLVQVLSIVEALSDYARSMGAPLADEEIDPRMWRERFSEIADRERGRSDEMESRLPSSDEYQPPQWVVKHLQSAGMGDVIDFVEARQKHPLAEWLPEVISSLKKAKMSLVEFLDPASGQTVPALVDTIVALDAGCGGSVEGVDAPSQVLLHHAARNHPAASVPMIIVALRRADMEVYVPGFIRSVGQLASASNLLVVLDALRSASLSSDAMELLSAIGSKRHPDSIIEVFDLFKSVGADEDADGILEEIGAAGLGVMVAFCRTIETSREGRNEIYNRIANGMDWSEPERYLRYFEKEGEVGMASIVREGIEDLERRKKELRL